MGTYTTGIPLITRKINPPPIPERRITVNKVIQDLAFNVIYGNLYNGYAIIDPRHISNVNWNVPTIDDINTISGGSGAGAFNYMSTRTVPDAIPRWNTPNSATDIEGLSILPSGVRDGVTGTFSGIGEVFYGWQKSTNYEHYRLVRNYDIWEHEEFNFRDGYAVRLVNTTTLLSEGEIGSYTGNDGKIYPTKVINGIEIMTVNLCETKYRNGDWIAFITTNSTWAILTSGAYCFYDNTQSNAYTYIIDEQKFLITIRNTVTGDVLGYEMVISQEYPIVLRQMPYGIYEVTESALAGYTNVSIIPSTFTISASNPTQVVEVINSKDPVVTTIKYGGLYNIFAVTDARNITNTGWEVPTKTQFETLQTYLGGDIISGGKLKETGLIYWNNPNIGADNSALFNGRGNGQRDGSVGTFGSLMNNCFLWTKTFVGYGGNYYQFQLAYNSAASVSNSFKPGDNGLGLRLIKTSTTLTHGQTGTYTGNDGKVYRTICIGTQEWLADNLNETKYRNGDLISVVTDNATWAALSTEGMCYYNNDESTYA